MKKLISLLITLSMAITFATVASAKTMYAPDGRTENVPDSDVQAWINVGWYERPVTRVYAPDGSSSVIYSSDLDNALAQGWYSRPVTTVYSYSGVPSLVYASDVPQLLAEGWFTEPVTTVYAPDGRTEIIPKKDLQAWLNVGWYADRATALSKAPSNIWTGYYTGMTLLGDDWGTMNITYKDDYKFVMSKFATIDYSGGSIDFDVYKQSNGSYVTYGDLYIGDYTIPVKLVFNLITSGFGDFANHRIELNMYNTNSGYQLGSTVFFYK